MNRVPKGALKSDDVPVLAGSGSVLALLSEKKAMPPTTSRMTARLNGLLTGTRTVSKVHWMNLPMGVMMS